MTSGEAVDVAPSSVDAAAGRGGTRRGATRGWILVLAFVGLLLGQVAWALAIPLFGGPDESDHVFRAASAVRGQILPSGETRPGTRGQLVSVPTGLARASLTFCEDQRLVGQDGCPNDLSDGPESTVGSSAASYNPAFYLVVGQASRGLDPVAGVTAMRLASALLVTVLVMVALWCTLLWSATAWPLLGLLVAQSPTFVFSSTMPSANALEMAAGLVLWSVAAGLRTPSRPGVERRLLWVALPAATVLVTVRSLGPLWLALLLVAAGIYLGHTRLRELWSRHRQPVVVSALVVGLALTASVAWILSARANALETRGSFDLTPSLAVQSAVIWIAGVVSSVPYTTSWGRWMVQPWWVYALYLPVVIAVVAAGLRRGDRRMRWALASIWLPSLAIPVVVTALTYASNGLLWQGRYGIVLLSGVLILATAALDDPRCRSQRLLIVGAWSFVAVASIGSLLWVARDQEHFGITHPWSPGAWWLAVLAFSGQLCWGLLLWMRTSTTRTLARSWPPDAIGRHQASGGYSAAERKSAST